MMLTLFKIVASKKNLSNCMEFNTENLSGWVSLLIHHARSREFELKST